MNTTLVLTPMTSARLTSQHGEPAALRLRCHAKRRSSKPTLIERCSEPGLFAAVFDWLNGSGLGSAQLTPTRFGRKMPRMPVKSAPSPIGTHLDATLLLAWEARFTYGPVPRKLGGFPVAEGESCLSGDAFLLRTGEGLSYYYRKGEGVTIEREPGFDPQDEALWLNGSVYAALASINGFKPIHASAIAHKGAVYAFTGPSGSGKSTLVAALGARGFPMFCDDTLVLDISDPSYITCLPGHKRLKLTAEALTLTSAACEEQVGASIQKYYARPAAGSCDVPLPLAKLIFLEEGPDPAFEPITGAQRFARLGDDHYTTDLFNRAHQPGPAGQFALQARLGSQIAMARLIRPRDTARFAESVTLTARYIIGKDASET